MAARVIADYSHERARHPPRRWLSASKAEGAQLSAALAAETERSRQAQADTVREQRDQLVAHKAQLEERCQALQAMVELEQARLPAIMAEKDVRLAEQTEVTATLNAELQRAQENANKK